MSQAAEFRSNALFTAKMRAVYSDEIVQRGFLAVKDDNLPQALPANADALASVRAHAYMCGYNDAIAKVLSLGDHIMPPDDYGTSEDYGTKVPVSAFDNPELP